MSTPEQIVSRLRERGQSLGMAESLTGGALASAVVSVPGASEVFRGGIVAYHREVKASVLRVPQELLERHGPVSVEVAGAMAEGARAVLGSDWALATTGVAGPDPDPQTGAVPGTVVIACVDPRGAVQTAQLALSGHRSDIREQTVQEALGMLGRALGRD